MFDNTNANPVPSEYFVSQSMPISQGGYHPVDYIKAYQNVISNKNCGNYLSTRTDLTSEESHDNIDQGYYDNFLAGTDSWQSEVDWIHPIRPSNPFYLDTKWNGIPDSFEQENAITNSNQVKSSYTWEGVTYVNNAGYDAFEAWSSIASGQNKVSLSLDIPISKNARL